MRGSIAVADKRREDAAMTDKILPHHLERKAMLYEPVQIGIAAGHLLHGSRLRRPLRG